jgi:SulP family sulfate permease
MAPSFSFKAWWGKPHRVKISGQVVAFAMIPEAIADYGIAGVDPRVGLYGALLMTGLVQQIAWGCLRLAHQMRFVPPPVMAGLTCRC